MKQLFIFLLTVFFAQVASAQLPILPAMLVTTENAQNKLSWTCQFDGVKSIAIQRSSDSIRNFMTIGVLTSPKKGIQTYTDTRPNVGKNYYRLSIEFAGDLEWFSNTYKVILDSATLAKSLVGAVNSGSTKATSSTTSSDETGIKSNDFYFAPSSRVYTNPYTGHINITLPDALSKKYNLKFYEPSKKEVLRISRVTKTQLVLDKNNFNARGTYQFELFDGVTLVETGYVTIY